MRIIVNIYILFVLIKLCNSISNFYDSFCDHNIHHSLDKSIMYLFSISFCYFYICEAFMNYISVKMTSVFSSLKLIKYLLCFLFFFFFVFFLFVCFFSCNMNQLSSYLYITFLMTKHSFLSNKI